MALQFSPFAIATIRIKYIGINLTKDVKKLYAKNYTALLKWDWKKHNEMERHSMFTDWKNHMVKCAILPKATHRFNAIPIKISVTF